MWIEKSDYYSLVVIVAAGSRWCMVIEQAACGDADSRQWPVLTHMRPTVDHNSACVVHGLECSCKRVLGAAMTAMNVFDSRQMQQPTSI